MTPTGSGFIPPYREGPVNKRWRPQRSSPHLWWHAGGRRLPIGQKPTRPDVRRDCPVSGTKQSAHGHPLPLQLTQPNCFPGHAKAPFPRPRSGYFSRLQFYRHSVGWANDPTCPDCHSTDQCDHTVAHLFSFPSHPTYLAPGDMWVAPLQVAEFLAGLPQFRDLTPLQIDLLLSLLTLIPTVSSLLLGIQRVHIIFISPFTPSHFTRGPEVISHLRYQTTTKQIWNSFPLVCRLVAANPLTYNALHLDQYSRLAIHLNIVFGQ